MADDPRRVALSRWRHVPAADASTTPSAAADPSTVPTAPTASAAAPQLRTRRTSPPTYPQQAPRSHGHLMDGLRSVRRAVGDDAWQTADRPSSDAFPGTARTQRPQPQRPQPPPQPRRPSRADDAYRSQREKQRDLQQQLARMMDAHRGSTVATPASSGAAYYELVSPARPLASIENGGGHTGKYTLVAATPLYGHGPQGAGRRVAPRDVMQELDEDFRRSFNEHQRQTVAMPPDEPEPSGEQRDDDVEEDEDEAGDTFDSYANGNGHDQYAEPPPVMDVRVQAPQVPFREELSSDLSDHTTTTPQSQPPSMDPDGNPYVPSHMPTSADAGLHFPVSTEFDYIPSISLTPPATPVHSAVLNGSSASASHESTDEHNPQPDERRRGGGASAKDQDSVVFPLWSIGFLAGCVVVGLGGIFMDEFMQLSGVFLRTSPFTLSRIEQREMNRRLDLLQQELLSFRVAASEIEQQSQRMVHEVRAHLDKMKSERERHQRMISKEMEALRRYVQAVTNELVEDEKKEIRKRLLETIADTIVELPDDLNDATREAESVGVPSTMTSLSDATKRVPTEEAIEAIVEIVVPTTDNDAAGGFEAVDEGEVMNQINQAVSKAPEIIQPTVAPTAAQENVSAKAEIGATAESRVSFLSLELFVLLTGIAIIAGVVGVRVRKANRRKMLLRHRKPAAFLGRFGAKTQPPRSTTEESDVETVSFFRSDSEADFGGDRSGAESESDFVSDYSEEQKDGDIGDDDESREEEEDETVSMSSRGTEYEFHAAEMSGDASNFSDIESLDDSPSSPSRDAPTPHPRMQQHLARRVADDSPTVRRSPRIQVRSSLAYMR